MAERQEPQWLSLAVALAVHDRQLAEHGGPAGVRDPIALESQGALKSALARPVNQWSYSEDDPCALAAAYAFGIARTHPFVDGNKRTAWVFARLFLRLNSRSLSFTPGEAVAITLALAAGEISEEELADWFHTHITD